MHKLKQTIALLFIVTIPSIVIAADWPPPIIFTVKFNIYNETSNAYSWQSSTIPLTGKNPISANATISVQGVTTEYTPDGTLLISDQNNLSNNCLVQDGIFNSSYTIERNAPAGSGFTCVIKNDNVYIEPAAFDKYVTIYHSIIMVRNT